MKRTPIVTGLNVRPARERGHADHGWLDARHSFSFADYYDPRHMGFRSLRVINEDRVAPSEGFDTHPHRDMEIFTYVIEGALAHKDSMGHASTIRAGDVQKITAGSGISHSERNASSKDLVHLYQIWLLPYKKGLTPSYQEVVLPQQGQDAPLLLVGAPAGEKALVSFHQDAYVFRGRLSKGQTCEYALKDGRGLWLQMVRGEVEVGNVTLSEGDGASVEQAGEIVFRAQDDSEFLLFDLA